MSISVQNITKVYGSQYALNDVSLEIEKGEVLGFLGPNGAGKSTLMKIITCYIPQTDGEVRVCDLNVKSQSNEIKKIVGYLPENTPLYYDMYVKEYLRFLAHVHKIPDRKRRVNEMIEAVGLELESHKKIGALSKGYKQRVGLAQALIHDPPILILDEPTSGLDPNQIEEIRALITELGQRKIILLSTHILSEFSSTCSRVLIINNGRLIADGSVENIVQQAQGGINIDVSFVCEKIEMTQEQIAAKLSKQESIETITAHTSQNKEYSFSILCKTDIRQELFHFAQEEGLSLTHLAQAPQNLDHAFRTLTS